MGAYANRVRALGWPLLLTGLALVVGIIALTQPLWAFQQAPPAGDIDRSTYGWTVVIEERWESGVWSSTTYLPYSSPSFSDFRMREVVTTSYSIGAAFVAAIFVFGIVQYVSRSRKVPKPLALVIGLGALGLGIGAVAYPTFTIPPAAALDVDSSITGFAGTATGPGNQVLTWGGAAGWWLWVAAAFLVAIAFIAPLLLRKPRSRAAPAR